MNPVNFIDPSAKIGVGTKVWHFAVILADVEIGEFVSIGSNCEIGRGCKIGSGSRISSGVFLPPNSYIGSHVFIGPHVVFTDDKYPRVNNPAYHAQPPIVHDEASIGAGSVILPGVVIHTAARVGAGSVVTKSVPSGVLVRGHDQATFNQATPGVMAESLQT